MNILLQAAGAQPGGSPWSFWVMIIAIFAIMYFFMIRPQKKRQKEIEKFRNSLAVGDEVITSGGIHGEVREIDLTTNTVLVQIAKGVCIKIEKSSIFAANGLPQQR